MAQSQNEKAASSSVYSKLGVGFPVSMANTAAQSMGLSGVSYNETYVSSIANPAHWGNTVYGLGSGGVKLQRFDASDANGSAQNTQFAINQFQLQLPLAEDPSPRTKYLVGANPPHEWHGHTILKPGRRSR